ncbi:aminotransferase class I/II-fold pyridoxal phosphate-dependent enzyme [Echinicola marina]|uniref:threonine aldolase family protein n=1 Tax=Echinicola marina TaxID=2859768 RepID=UPI001CF717C8|nr:GntG family PLP-dependent aldolase [Echinicola marina]UCS93393.1 aminotransferase class I/II-fold pyridoxal phosphate-dependent enzyme [Echinicola marina]
MNIELRSDTFTKPTTEMKQAMFEAEVGDDVFGEDPSVNRLEEKLASIFGMQAGLFCPSGTMTNQIAVKLHTGPQKEVICHKNSHIFLYEAGGIMSNAFASVRLLEGELGKVTAEEVKEAVNPYDVHAAESALVSLENTMNKGGGSIYTLDEVRPIKKVCEEEGLKLHLDGARIFNALVESKESASDWGTMFDTISVCLSKGLGCPVGSVLLGDKETVKRARRIRKSMGGGMRQAGYLAAAGIYALDHHVERLAEDHRRAKVLGSLLQQHPNISEILPVHTNIVIAKLEGLSPKQLLSDFALKGIRAVQFGKDQVRFVTHMDFTDVHLEEFKRKFLPS